ncbi:MAG: hypothetical protein K8T90_12215 [Planctomycetes bacterium]|nr:hypothetical protein [Planctomycetota bacterium]
MTDQSSSHDDTLRDEAGRFYQERVRFRDQISRAATIEGSVLILVLAGLTQANEQAWNTIRVMRPWLIAWLIVFTLLSAYRVGFVQWRYRVASRCEDELRTKLQLERLPRSGGWGLAWAIGAMVLELSLAAMVVAALFVSEPSKVVAVSSPSTRAVSLSHDIPKPLNVHPLFGAPVTRLLNLAASNVANGGVIEVANGGRPVPSDVIPKGGDLRTTFAVDLSLEVTLKYLAVPGAEVSVTYDFE